MRTIIINLTIVILTLLYSCDDFTYKKDLYNGFYLVEHPSNPGKSIDKEFKNGEAYLTLLLDVSKVRGNKSLILVMTKTRNNKESFFVLDPKKVDYKEDIREVSSLYFDSLYNKIQFDYDYNF